MYGLIMLREYLDEIIVGKKSYDARAYNTSKRGTIALIDSKRSEIIGTIDLNSVHEITADEYCKWHTTGKLEGTTMQVEDPSKVYYAYDFSRPRLLKTPIKIKKTGRVWTKIDDAIVSSFIFTSHLYESRHEIDGTTYIVRTASPSTADEKIIKEKVKNLILRNLPK